MNKGDVVWVALPKPKGSQTREQVGSHPAIVIQDESNYSNLPLVIVVPLTSNKNALRFSTSILITRTIENGLDVDSVAMPFQSRAVDRKRVFRIAGKLSQQDLSLVENEVKKILGV